MLTSKLAKAYWKGLQNEDGGAAVLTGIGLGLFGPLVLAVPATTLALDAVIEPCKAAGRAAKRRSESREWERHRRHKLQMQRERIEAAERAAELRRLNQPKPETKQERLETLNVELLANLRLIDVSLIPDEDKVALRNRETDLYQSKLRRLLEG